MVIKRREDELLLQCVRGYIDPSEAERIEGLASQDIDWEYAIQAALAHRVVPLLYHSLHMLCPKAVPNLIMGQLRELYQSNARRNLFLTSELLKLVKLLETDGISAIAFKGPVLSMYAYRNHSLRQYLDLDILVRKRDVLRAKDLLILNGYQLGWEMTEKQERAHLESYHAFVFVPKSAMYSVDLHWAIAQQHYSFSFNSEVLWEQVESISFGGSSILTFRPEQMIVILSMHGSKHCWEHLGWICDVAQLVSSRADLDWQRALCEAQKAKCFRELLLALRLAKNLVGAPVPDGVLDVVNTYPGLASATRRVTKQLFCAEQPHLWRRFQQMTLICRLRERLKDGLVYLLYELRRALTPNSKDYAIVSLPVPFSFLHYIIRFIRLTMSYGLSPLIRLAKLQKGG